VDHSLPPSLRDRRRAETAREIAHAGLELFAVKGFDAATADEIARRAGVSRATFFNYFPQKELILSEFARSRLERVQSLLDARGALSLGDVLGLFVSFAEENERIGLHGRGLLPQAILRPACQEVLQPLLANAQASLAAGLAKGGELDRGVNPRVFAETFFSTFFAATVQWAVHLDPPPGSHRRTVRERLGLLVRLARKGGSE